MAIVEENYFDDFEAHLKGECDQYCPFCREEEDAVWRDDGGEA